MQRYYIYFCPSDKMQQTATDCNRLQKKFRKRLYFSEIIFQSRCAARRSQVLEKSFVGVGKLRGRHSRGILYWKQGWSTVNSQQLICSVTPFFVFVAAYNNRAYLSIIYTKYI